MSRIPLVEPASAEGKAQTLLDAVQKKMGMVPNITRALATAPAVLEAYLNFSAAIAGTSLSPKLREQLAIQIAEINSCGYCLSAHGAIGSKIGLSSKEISDARRGHAKDPQSDAALALSRAIVLERGNLRDDDLRAARSAGLNDEEIVEIFGTTVLNVFTNWFNHMVDTPIDFPVVEPGLQYS